MTAPLPLRPHHGLCLQHFAGSGYSAEFVRNMGGVLDALTQNPGREIVLVCHADAICRCCPHNRAGACASGQKVERYDGRCLELCGLAAGAALPWREFRRLVRERILESGLLGAVCAGCEWIDLCGCRGER